MLILYIFLIPVASVYTICTGKPEPTCGQNATYVDCPSACPATCKSPNERNCNKKCEPKGCRCNPSYLLSKPKGQCILSNDCPGGNPCPKNETFVACSIGCPTNYCPVDDSLAVLICDPAWHCPSGCSCKSNHKRKSVKDPRCILASECPPVKCTRPNEEWHPCTNSCLREKCYHLKENHIACKPYGCEPRCACKQGYYRNETDICIPASQCFPEESCDIKTECKRTCAQPNPKNCSYQTVTENVKGCKCKPGFILSDKDGDCIEIEKCPQQLGCNNDPNAVVTSCPPPCPATCQSPRDAPCKKMCLDIGCRCKNGYILSELNGRCVKPEACPGGDPCGKNATFSSCSNRCPYNFCPKDDSQTNYDCKPQSPCPAGCICKLNHKRKSQQDDQCILSSDCPPVNCTRPNEVWDSCPSACLRESCKDAGKKPSVCNTLVFNCQPKCVCKPNTYKDKNNVCVPVDKCSAPPPIKCGVNEEYSNCKITCPPQFCNISYTDYGICPNDTKCEPGCNCIKDHLRDFQGKCVLNDNCPPPPTPCGGNATSTDCASACPPTCETPKPEVCIDLCKPNVTCQCKPNYVLSPKGDCILPEDCPAPPPPICGQNEVATVCKTRCPSDLCDSEKPKGICRPGPCRHGCNCKEGYARDSTGKCIPKEKCPKTPTPCGSNATYTECASSCPPTCETSKSGFCIALCKPNVKCKCKPSYVLSPNGDCILPQDCPAPAPVVCGQNEVPTVCKKTCPSDSCDSEKQQGICRPGPCRRGCNCKEGCARDSSGNCIPKDQCPVKPITCGANATLVNCTSACLPNCETPKPEVCFAICNPKGCQCKPSYVLSPKGDCPAAPPPIKCGVNEEYSNCKITCPPQFCNISYTDYGICPNDTKCEPGCNCIKDHLRDFQGKCVLNDNCPPPPTPCGGNATSTDCASACPPTCESRNPGPCAAVCKPNVTCQCKPNYVLSANGQCILPEDCPAPPPPVCGANEVSIVCKTWCTSDSCDSKKPEGFCRPGPCRRGCICKEGFARDSNGKCIPKDQCPKPPTACGGNATYTSCASSCPLTCQEQKPVPCIKLCKPNETCQCKPSYVLSPKGNCVLPQDCPAAPPVKCGVNEEYSNCTITCPPQFCNISYTDYGICPNDTKCVPGCNCIKDHLRDSQGKCVLNDNCPPPPTPCGGNATSTDCASSCPPTCETPNPEVCIYSCKPNVTCQCMPGYVLSPNGDCILPEDCPAPPPPVCGQNEVATVCKTRCPSDLCDIEKPKGICRPGPCRHGCNCKEGYARDSTGKCIPKEKCPKKPIVCGANATFVNCTSACPPTCETPKPEVCIDICNPKGCQCKPNYVLSPKGDCILPQDCPAPNPCGGNATYTDCASSCPPTCESRNPGPCAAVCKPNVTCQCKPNYVLLPNGQCILPEDCPAPPPPVCAENEVSIGCKTWCTSDSCDSKKPEGFCRPGPCRRGCICKEGFARDSNGKCIPKDQCPKPPTPCGGNATYTDCASSCPLTCQEQKPVPCIALCKLNVTCQCKPSYVLSPNGDCILPQDCPAPNRCGENATYTDCASSCPPTCESRYPGPCAAVCKPNVTCECKPNYVLSANGQCILPEDCPAPPPPACGENEVSIGCKTWCTSDSCDSQKPEGFCRPGPCRRGCICKEGFARDSNGKCIPKDQCPKPPTPCGGNATYTDCASSCPLTCQEQKPVPCISLCKPNVTCQCKPSYVLSPNGDCILPEDCPAPPTCGGNATLVDCASACPSTCQTPNPKSCIQKCNPNSCQCKYSYILSKPQGECILPKDCPGGSPCSQNETFVSCNARCPNSYCPVDDSQGILICDPPRYCPSGCSCKLNYKRKSIKDPRCILAEECPPVKCTRPNEEWNTCPTSCLKENCEDLKLTNTACKPSRTNCQPRCACKEGFYRNASRICVPASECFPTKKCDIPDQCQATCANPNPKDCPYKAATENVEGCKCKTGYVLSDKNGVCIRIEDCPVDSGCNGDNNALITKCPPPCPSTCDSPNEGSCKKSCLPVGCKCKDGFILSKLNGLCVKPENCTGGNPCKNGSFSTCVNKCPYNYCPIDDSPPDYNCTAPTPCRSGCVCRFNHRKKSVNDDQCILASDCPPVKCTRPNEVWDSCPSACLNEGCENAGKKSPICYTLILNCDPRCVCKPNTYRDKNNVCVPVDKCPSPPVVCGDNEVETCKFDDGDTKVSVCKPTCDCKKNYSRHSNGTCIPDNPPGTPKICDVPRECRRTCAEPNPKNCSYKEVSENENGCKCKPGYILLDKDGECVNIESCPPNLGCNGDANALVSQCPPPCPSTCAAPNEILCKKACLDVGCKCKEGFILSKLNGLCIPPEKCKGGNPCGKNATFSSCSNRCSYNYCPKDDSPPVYDCALPYRCPSGCVCNINYRKKSIDDRQCILASECPPVNCTRPNEVWDSCPSDCLQEKCEDAGKILVPCDTFVLNCQPKCVCKKNTYRNKDKICVPVKRCPKKKPTPCDPVPINY